MVFKRPLAACLALLALLSALPAAAAELRGFSPQEGPAFALFGRYPAQADGQAEPVLWRVLRVADGQALLLSDRVLDVRPAHSGEGYDGFETSTLAAWLNGDFPQAAFDPAEQAAVLASGVPVSLPSADLLRDKALGFSGARDRMAAPTAYALSRGVLAYRKGAQAGYWMADKAQSMSGAQRRVLEEGNLGYIRADAENIGVRPLVTLSLQRVSAVSGAGTREEPFALTLDGGPLPTPSPVPPPTPAPTRQPVGSVSVEGFPALTKDGFLPEGEPEYVFVDAENGVWRYASGDLRIVITRHTDTEKRVRWLGAEIFVRDGAEPFRMVPFDKEHMLEDRKKYLEKPAVIMRQNNLVFSMDGDYFIYRHGRAVADKKNYAIGVVIRDGEILIDRPASTARNQYPPLDMLALFPDGDMRVYKANELTADELIALGARDVLSFGPFLIRDGEINTTYVNYGTTLQPRAAIGMVDIGHYWAVIVEGRIKPSRGMTAREVADLMMELGCRTAFNLDGGWTSAMVFMGRQLNQLDKSGVHDNARTQNEVMGIGYTDAYLEGRAP